MHISVKIAVLSFLEHYTDINLGYLNEYEISVSKVFKRNKKKRKINALGEKKYRTLADLGELQQ